jgi:hypothetical protein
MKELDGRSRHRGHKALSGVAVCEAPCRPPTAAGDPRNNIRSKAT